VRAFVARELMTASADERLVLTRVLQPAAGVPQRVNLDLIPMQVACTAPP